MNFQHHTIQETEMELLIKTHTFLITVATLITTKTHSRCKCLHVIDDFTANLV